MVAASAVAGVGCVVVEGFRKSQGGIGVGPAHSPRLSRCAAFWAAAKSSSLEYLTKCHAHPSVTISRLIDRLPTKTFASVRPYRSSPVFRQVTSWPKTLPDSAALDFAP